MMDYVKQQCESRARTPWISQRPEHNAPLTIIQFMESFHKLDEQVKYLVEGLGAQHTERQIDELIGERQGKEE